MASMTRLSITFVLLIQLLGIKATARVCNNAAALCSRTYDNVTYLGAHDSPFVRNNTNGYSIAGDQVYTTVQQLEAGVRLVTAQIHAVTTNGHTQYRLCHTLCQLYDAGLLVDWLSGIREWLDQNPNEVITILLVNSDSASASTLNTIYQSSGLADYSYQPSSLSQRPTTWPTLNSLISSNKRVINFIANLDPTTNTAAPYLLDEFTFVFETSYENFVPSDFSCEPNRPSFLANNIQSALASPAYLPLMNHFRYNNINGFDIPDVSNANVTNSDSLNTGIGALGDTAATCARAYGRAPTFILVDFANVGPAIDTVDRLNGVSGQTNGRLIVPDTYSAAIADPSPTSVQTDTATASATGSTSAGSTAFGLPSWVLSLILAFSFGMLVFS